MVIIKAGNLLEAEEDILVHQVNVDDLTEENGKYIANMFSQRKNFTTDYMAMQIALKTIREYAEQECLTVAMPYKIGCRIAKGDFNIVLDIISKVFINYEVVLYKLEV